MRTLVAISALLFVACNAIVGVGDVEVVPPDAPTERPDATNDPTIDGSVPDAADADAAPANTGTVGGAVHFAQSGSVVLENAGEEITVGNGAFTFTKKHAPTDTFDVKVKTPPTNQTCWVAKGSGTVGAGISDVDVRCVTAVRSISTLTDHAGTSSTAFTPMTDTGEISITSDVSSTALVSLSVPQMTAFYYSFTEYAVGITVDDVLVSEAANSSEYWSQPYPASILTTVALSPGPHKVRAVWRYVGQVSTGAQAFTAEKVTRPYQWTLGGAITSPTQTELDVVILDSLRTYDKTISSSTTTPASVMPAAGIAPFGIPPLDFDSTAQPAFFFANTPKLVGDYVTMRLRIDGNVAASQLVSYEGHSTVTRSFSPMALAALTAGKHTADAAWDTFGSAGHTVTYGAPSSATAPRAELAAILFKPSANVANVVSTSRLALSTSTFTTLSPMTTQVTLAAPRRALVFAAATTLFVLAQDGTAEAGIFVNDTVGPMVVTQHPTCACESLHQGIALTGIVDLPAGTSTIDLRVRSVYPTNGSVRVGAGQKLSDERTVLGVIVLD